MGPSHLVGWRTDLRRIERRPVGGVLSCYDPDGNNSAAAQSFRLSGAMIHRGVGAASFAVLAALALPAMAAEAPAVPGILNFRFDEDYSSFADPARRTGPMPGAKYIPIGDGGAYVSLGGELRERVEWYGNPDFGIGRAPGAARNNSYLLQRALVHADLHVDDHVRVFVQLGHLSAFGQNRGSLGPVQDDRGDVVQAFADVGTAVGGGGRLTARIGRQEMAFGSGRLVSERDGPNLRRTFDGGRVFLVVPGGYRVDAFVTRPVQPGRETFDDSSNRGEAFWGVYATGPTGLLPGLSADLYYFGYNRAQASFAQGSGFEQRHTIGGRLFGRRGGWDWDVEAAGQFGRFGGAAIRAWTVASDTGYTLAGQAGQPRFGLKVDVASGDGNSRDHTLGTFNALYPKVPYFTEAGLAAPANLIDVFPSIRVQPAEAVTVEVGWDVLWRQRTSDAFYRPAPFGPIKGTAGIGDAYVGHQVQVAGHWAITPNVDLKAWYVHFTPGATITRAGGNAVDFAASSLAFKF